MLLTHSNRLIWTPILFLLLGMMGFEVFSQSPTVSLSLNKSSISEAGGTATLTATLSAPTDKDVTILLKPSGTASYQGDYDADFTGKGLAKTVAGGNGAGSEANQLSYPSGIFVDKSGNIFISDSGNNRIQKYAPEATSGVTVAGGQWSGFRGEPTFFSKWSFCG